MERDHKLTTKSKCGAWNAWGGMAVMDNSEPLCTHCARFGLFWTLSNFCATINPRDAAKPVLGQPRKIGEGCRFNSFTTNNYKLHFYETPSGLKFVLNTSRDVGELRELLITLYDEVFVEHVIKSPVYDPGQPFVIDQFNAAVDKFFLQRGLLQHQMP